MLAHFDPVNFMSIELLSRLGIDTPTERQINIIESLLSSSVICRPVFFNERLNEKENLCLLLAAQGKSSKETALLLELTQTQVEFYRKEIRRKLVCDSMAQAVFEGIRYGYLKENVIKENNATQDEKNLVTQ